jgi:hypothetical protein
MNELNYPVPLDYINSRFMRQRERNVPFVNEQYLTDRESESDDEDEYYNLYNFLSTEARKNIRLEWYLAYNGLDSRRDDLSGLTSGMIYDIYKLLDGRGKKMMRTTYLDKFKKIAGDDNFNFIGKGQKRTNKRKKTNKTKRRIRTNRRR